MDGVERSERRWSQTSCGIEQLGVEVNESKPIDDRVGGAQLLWHNPRYSAPQLSSDKVRGEQSLSVQCLDQCSGLGFLDDELGQRRRVERDQRSCSPRSSSSTSVSRRADPPTSARTGVGTSHGSRGAEMRPSAVRRSSLSPPPIGARTATRSPLLVTARVFPRRTSRRYTLRFCRNSRTLTSPTPMCVTVALGVHRRSHRAVRAKWGTRVTDALWFGPPRITANWEKLNR